MATAILKGYQVTEEDVYKVKAPKPTDTWHPISHGMLLDEVYNRLKNKGYKIDGKGQFSLAKGKAQMFATFNLKSERDDFTLALGVRNSIDKSLPAGLCCGSRVFVCDNLCFSSDIVFGRRHTMNIMADLPNMIDTSLQEFDSSEKRQEVVFNRMKKVRIDLSKAMDVLNIMGEKEILPKPKLFNVLQEFREPRFDALKGDTAWTLYNACTTFHRHDRKDIDPVRSQAALLGIHETVVHEFSLN